MSEGASGCHVCGEVKGLPYTCNYCGGRFCRDHRLPEKHRCYGLSKAGPPNRKTRTVGPSSGSDRAPISNAATNTSGSSAIWFVLLAAILLVTAIAVGPVSSSLVLPPKYAAPIDDTLKGIAADPGGQAVGQNNSVTQTKKTTAAPSQTATAGVTSTSDPKDTQQPSSLDRTRLEKAVHEEVNSVRADNGLSTLDFDSDLRQIARYHSDDMATNEYFAHDSPSGETMADRYDRFGYNCRVQVSSNRYATGGENIYTTRYSGLSLSEREIAEMTVSSWMESPGHRENLLRGYWQNEGIGVAISSDGGGTEIYVTQNFC